MSVLRKLEATGRRVNRRRRDGAHPGLHQHAYPPLRIAAGQELRRGHGTAAVLPVRAVQYLPVRSMAMDEEAAHACLAYSMAELLRTGTTTVMEIGAYAEEAVRQAGRVGMRLYMGLGYRSGRWYTDDGKEVKYAWDEEAGLRAMERAVRFIEEHDGSQNGRIKGFSPHHRSTPAPKICYAGRARQRDDMRVPLALHTSQSVNEFLEMTRRHGLHRLNGCATSTSSSRTLILGHAIIVAPGSWTNWSR